MTDLPRWAQMLRQERKSYGEPTLREIGNWIGVSHAAVGNWLNGRVLPEPELLEKLLTALMVDQDLREEITALIEADRRSQQHERKQLRQAQKQPRQDIEPSDPRRLSHLEPLAEAINNLADAIRGSYRNPR